MQNMYEFVKCVKTNGSVCEKPLNDFEKDGRMRNRPTTQPPNEQKLDQCPLPLFISY